ncbi:MAG: MBL fold metallo-hydrolase [Deltaproteobacteria bacterium]|nr:MBL fold metallo-hydrolase [Deltaproteobacteria bacterium]
MKLQWLGWSTFRLDVPGGPTLLLDPCVSALLDDRHARLKDLDGADAILLTHGHHEHIKDLAEVVKHVGPVPILAPTQVREYLIAYRDIPRDRFVTALPGESARIAGVTVRSWAFPHLPKHDVKGKLGNLKRDNPLGAPWLLVRHGPRIVRSWFAIKRQPEFGPFLAYDMDVAGRRVFFTCEAFTELLESETVRSWRRAAGPVDLAVVGVESGQEHAAGRLTEELGAGRSVSCAVHATFERFYGKPAVDGESWRGGRADRAVWSVGDSLDLG